MSMPPIQRCTRGRRFLFGHVILNTDDVTSVATPAPRVSVGCRMKWHVVIWLLNLNENLITIMRAQGPGRRGRPQAGMAGPASASVGLTPAGGGGGSLLPVQRAGREQDPPATATP